MLVTGQTIGLPVTKAFNSASDDTPPSTTAHTFDSEDRLYFYCLVSTIPLPFLQRVSIACYAERCISYDRFCLTVRPSV